MDEADRVNPHTCKTAEGHYVLCYCVRAQDHDEETFDLPVEQEGRN